GFVLTPAAAGCGEREPGGRATVQVTGRGRPVPASVLPGQQPVPGETAANRQHRSQDAKGSGNPSRGRVLGHSTAPSTAPVGVTAEGKDAWARVSASRWDQRGSRRDRRRCELTRMGARLWSKIRLRML